MATFKVEAEEHLQTIASRLVELETTEDESAQSSIIEIVFREAHSLKGAARAVNLADVETICQSMETIFSAMKRRKLNVSSEVCDALHAAVDVLAGMLADDGARSTARAGLSSALQRLAHLEKGQPGETVTKDTSIEIAPAVPVHQQVDEERLNGGDLSGGVIVEKREESKEQRAPALKTQEAPRIEPSAGKETQAAARTIRIETSKLDSLLLQAEELVSVKLTMKQCSNDLEQILLMFECWKQRWARIHPDAGSLRRSLERTAETNGKSPVASRLVALLDFLKWNDEQIKCVGSASAHVAATVDHERRALGGMADNLLEEIKKVFMTPVSSLLETFPKLVRDLSHDLTKEVDLVLEGGEIEISRRILEQLKDPLIHIIRNSIDHGIENVEGRIKARKPARATLRIAVSQVDSNNVSISISDDGSGIDVRRVTEAAINHGILSADESARMNRQEALSLIFESDLSTSPIISDLSGRGLGLAIVREKVEKLGGSVAVATDEGRGTTFRLLLPVTLASFRGILVRAAGRLFIVPTSNVERAIRVKAADVKSVENRETIALSGRSVSLVRLADVLSLPQTQAAVDESDFIQLLVLGAGDRRIALGVDQVLNEQEVLVKGLGAHLKRVPNISAATVLGSGQLAPILNVEDLLKSAARMGSPCRVVAQAGEGERKKKSILIAEDSITSRMLLKNILESAGYDVRTAMDGVDAFATLTNETFDLLVSDIEMPRMNGLDLTSKIRGDKKLAGLPVVLVTSLGSREDREQGIDVGANAYIVKSSFDQSNLLEVVRRLV